MAILRKVVLLLLIPILFIGCTNLDRRVMVRRAETTSTPKKLAVLPIANETNDVAGGLLLQEIIYNKIKTTRQEYDLQDINITTEKLREMGITDGGQLKVMDPQKIEEALGVDGLLYTKLTDLGLITYPAYHIRKIAVVSTLTYHGMIVIEAPLAVSNKYFSVSTVLNTISDPKEGLAQALAEASVHQVGGLITAGVKSHKLYPEMNHLANIIAKKLLPRPGIKGSKIELQEGEKKEYERDVHIDKTFLTL